jgi:hypothetical protein
MENPHVFIKERTFQNERGREWVKDLESVGEGVHVEGKARKKRVNKMEGEGMWGKVAHVFLNYVGG